jgi:hypothetical protein
VEIKEHAWFCSTDVEEIEVQTKTAEPTDEPAIKDPKESLATIPPMTNDEKS